MALTPVLPSRAPVSWWGKTPGGTGGPTQCGDRDRPLARGGPVAWAL
jgi:hypothetical protein